MSESASVSEKESGKREIVKRVLLTDKQAKQVSDLLSRLRDNSCRADTSKIVNEILSLFFKKHEATDFKLLKDRFFDKKNYLKQLINSSSSEDIDESIKQYLSKTKPTKRRGRKPKSSSTPNINEEAPSS